MPGNRRTSRSGTSNALAEALEAVQLTDSGRERRRPPQISLQGAFYTGVLSAHNVN